MSTFATLLKDSDSGELHRLIRSEGEKYVCFTRVAATPALIVGVTDGVSLWRVTIDEEELEALRDLANINTPEAFLTKFRNGFQAGDLSVSVMGAKLTMSVGKGASPLSLDLYEAKAADKKIELQNVLFRLAEMATSFKSDLDKANQTIDTLKAQKGGGGASAFMDLGPQKTSPVKAKPKKAGMSVLNPTSKKRKAAQGVVFD